MLAIIKSFQQYRVELTSAQNVVKVYTDHKALEYFMTTKELSGRQARWAEFLSEFCFMIMYRPGKLNTVADTLSRREQDVTAQEAKRREVRQQTLLPLDKLDSRIQAELPNLVYLPKDINMSLSPILGDDEEELEIEKEVTQ